MKHIALALIALLGLMGCGEEEILHYRVPKEKGKTEQAAAHPLAQTDTQSHPSEFKWDLPEGWTYEAGSGMRMATFKFNIDGAPIECTLVKLGAMAGGLLQNINRWRGQIGLAASNENDLSSSLVNLKGQMGEFKLTEQLNPETNQAILASIFESNQFTLFVKIMASADQIKKVKDSFTSFSASIRQ